MSKEALTVALIPAYNEEKNIAAVVLQAQTYVDKVIVCDDGSEDMTCGIAEALGATVVRHRRNLGYGAALLTLFKEARKLNPDAVVTLDADGQHDPAHIPALIEPVLGNGADIVIGSRFLSEEGEEKLPAYRKIGIRLITGLANKASYNGITDAQSGFRAYNRKALKVIQPTKQGMGASIEILIKARQANLKVKEIPIIVNYEGKTTKRNPIVHWFDVILSTVRLVVSGYPQVFYGVAGTLTLSVAVGFWTWSALTYITTGEIVSEITFASIGTTVISLILLTTAIILSEYTKYRKEDMKRPKNK